MKKCFSLIFIVISLFSGYLGAQNQYFQTIRGTVIDKASQVPLPGASIVMLDSDPLVGTTTDVKGEFSLEKIPLGRVGVRVSYVGYHSVTLSNLSLNSGKELVLRIELEEQVFTAAIVEIKAEGERGQALNRMASVSAQSFNIEQTERYAGSLGDPSRMAANFAGVASPSDQRNDIIIRGNSPGGLLWRLDGIDIPNPNHYGSLGSTGGPVSILNNNVLANSDFYTGAFPAEFGNALAGAFDLKMRNGNNKNHEFMGQIGFNGFEAGLEGPINRATGSSYLLNVRYSTLEVFNAMGMDVGTGAAVPQYRDMALKINLPTKKLGRFSLFGIGGNSYIEMLDSKNDSASFGFSGSDLYYGSDMGVLGLSHVYFFSDKARITTTAAASTILSRTDMYDLAFQLDKENIIQRDREDKYAITTKYSHKINARNFYNIGLVYELHNINYDGKILDTIWNRYFQYLDSKGNINMVRGFAEWQHKFSDKLVLNTGLHGIFVELNNNHAIEPRAGLRWFFAKGQSLNFGAGMHSQIQPKALYFTKSLVDTLNDKYVETNKKLEMSRSIQFVAGYEIRFSKERRFKTEVYYQHLYNIPVAKQRPEYSALNQGADFTYWAYDFMQNTGNGKNMGVEFTLEKFLNKGFYYLLTASFFNSTFKGYDNVERNTSFNNNYVINVLAGYEWLVGSRNVLAADLKAVVAGGKPYLPIDTAASILQGEAVYDWSNAYGKRHPEYFRLNARITFRLNGKKVNQEWGLDLQNLTNHRNVFTQNWNRTKNELTTSYQQSFMPMMTYKIYF
jgi:hypothetical protein